LDHFDKSDDFKKKDALLTFVYSIIDWLDSGDDDAVSGTAISAYGAESEFYRDMDPPYECRNGPFVFDEELTKVRGYDFFSVPAPERKKKQKEREKEEKRPKNGPGKNVFKEPGQAKDDWGFDENAHIPDYVTIRGVAPVGRGKFKYDGKININTATLPVLLAMFSAENREFARWIHSTRKEAEEKCAAPDTGGFPGAPNADITKSDWHHSGPGWESLSLAEKKLVKTSSDLFRIESVATIRDRTLTAEAIVKRQGGKKKKTSCKILNLSFK
jgi:general secretion pathway protein K